MKTLFHETKLKKTVSTSSSLPQNTKVVAGSGTRECRQKEARPAPLGLLAHPGCPVSAPRSQFLHSSGALHGKS